MVKTKKTVNNSTKSVSNATLLLQDYPKSFWKYNIFNKEVRILTSILYCLIIIALLSTVNLLKSVTNYVSVLLTQALTISLMGIPLVLFAGYGIFYLFLNAFEDKRKPFWESFFVFASMALSYILIGHLITFIQTVITNSILYNIVEFVLFALMTYFMVAFVLNFKNYYGTSAYRVIVSFVLITTIIGIFSVVYYFQILLSSVSGV